VNDSVVKCFSVEGFIKAVESSKQAPFCSLTGKEQSFNKDTENLNETEQRVEVHPNKKIKLEEGSPDVCDWVGALKNAAAHYETCAFKTVICSNSGCNFETIQKALPLHEKHCLFRIIACEWCFENKTLIALDEHKKICVRRPIKCPNNCKVGELCSDETTMIPADEVKKHQSICQLEPIDCPFKHVGCGVVLVRRDMKLHVEDTSSLCLHVVGLMKTLNPLQEEINTLKSKLETSQMENRNLNERIDNIDAALQQNSREIAILNSRRNNLDFLIPVPVNPTAKWVWESWDFKPIHIGKPACISLSNADAHNHACFLFIGEIGEGECFRVEADFFLETADGSPTQVKSLTRDFTLKNSTWGFKPFIRTSDLAKPKYRNSEGNIRLNVRLNKVSVVG